jgi:hypothetical protein
VANRPGPVSSNATKHPADEIRRGLATTAVNQHRKVFGACTEVQSEFILGNHHPFLLPPPSSPSSSYSMYLRVVLPIMLYDGVGVSNVALASVADGWQERTKKKVKKMKRRKQK